MAFGLTATITNYATILSTDTRAAGTACTSAAHAALRRTISDHRADLRLYRSECWFRDGDQLRHHRQHDGSERYRGNFISRRQPLVVDPARCSLGPWSVPPQFEHDRTGGTSPGRINDFGASFANFGTVLVDAGATWTFAGRSHQGQASTGDVSIGDGAIWGHRRVEFGRRFHTAGGTLHIAGTMDAAISFDLSGRGSGLLRLDAVTGTTFDNAITGFGDHDTITLPASDLSPAAASPADGGTLSIPPSRRAAHSRYSISRPQGNRLSWLARYVVGPSPASPPGRASATNADEVAVVAFRGTICRPRRWSRRAGVWTGRGDRVPPSSRPATRFGPCVSRPVLLGPECRCAI